MHLIIAEKNIAAQRIAGILAENKKPSVKREEGVNTYSFDDKVAIGLRGHVVEIDFEPGYSNWRSETHTPKSLIDAGTIKKPTEKRIVQLIKRLAKKADHVIIATDFDREGELIGKEAYEIVRSANKTVPIKRARFSAITKQEITNAFANPAELDFNLAEAGEARQVVDLIWGASLTRFISLAAKRGGNNILSVGRVQSPTLAMIVDREKEIEAFVPEPYWMISLDSEKEEEIFEARHTEGKFWDKESAERSLKGTKEPLTVTDIKEGTRADHAPTPFDTTAYIVAASRLGLSASNAMRIAEELYMNGYISYPRTDNTIYPSSLDLKGILTELKKSPFKREVEWVSANMRPSPTRGKKSSTDHPPIHPTAAASKADMDETAWKVYELVVRRFLATLSPDARWKTLKYTFDAGGEPYASTGQRLDYGGYRIVYTYSQAKEQALPVLAAGEKLPILDIRLEEKETLPPPRYSQSKLIQVMEELGLGTKSTRHDVIGKLFSRRYVEGNPLKPTLVGRAVTESLEDHAGLITKPDMTRTLEEHMEEIKKSILSKGSVVQESREMLHEIFESLEANKEDIGSEIMDKTAEERVVGKCPVCGKSLMIRTTKGMAQFIGCTGYPDCSFNIGLPSGQWGKAIRDNKICEIHGMNHIRLVRKGSPPWDLGCPLCNHISSNLETLNMIPSISKDLISNLHSHNIYTVYEIANENPEKLSKVAGISKEDSEKLIREADEVLELLRKRSELKKFVRKIIPPKRGRSHAKVLNMFFDAGIVDMQSLARTDKKTLEKMKLSTEEAESLIHEARLVYNKAILKEYGVPAVSLKKYFDAGFVTPKDFCYIHPAYLSAKTGLNIDTVYKHAAIVCEATGVRLPDKVSKKELESGRTELLSIEGLGEAMLEKLYMAGIVSRKKLCSADPEQISKLTGIPSEKITYFQEECK